MSVDERKLREKMEMILDFMVQEKLISKEACEKMKEEKDGLLDNLVNDFSNAGMEDKDIRDASFQHKLMGIIVSHSLGKEADAKMGMALLSTALTLKAEDPDNTLEKTLSDPEANKLLDQLQAQSIVLSNALNHDKLHLNPLKIDGPKPDFNAIAVHMLANFKKDMQKKFENNDKEKKEFEKLSKEIERQLTDALRNAYGGDDPRIAGEVTGPIMGPILTVMIDWIEPQANPTSVAARVMEATENSPGHDPMGIKDKTPAIEKATDILSPIIDMVSAELDHQAKLTPKLNHQ